MRPSVSHYLLCLVGSTSFHPRPGREVGGKRSPCTPVISVGEALQPRGPTSTYCPDWGTFSPGLYGVKLAPFCSSRSGQERTYMIWTTSAILDQRA